LGGLRGECDIRLQKQQRQGNGDPVIAGHHLFDAQAARAREFQQQADRYAGQDAEY
jgi:hypothetical protein